MSLLLIFEYILSFLGVAADATLFVLLLKRRAWREYPFFFLYITESLITALGMNYVYLHVSSTTYFYAYLWDMGVSSLLQFALLVELSWSVLKPIRGSLPRGTWLVISLMVAVSGALLWPLVGMAHMAHITPAWDFFFKLQQTISILRIGFFVILVSLSQLLAIGWRNRELQIATGLGFYSLIYLVINILHTYKATYPYYHKLDQALLICYFCTLMVWVLSFAIQEPDRRKFTPQMAGFLLYLSGSAKSNRLLVTNQSITSDRSKDD
jgi:hypothetical protein